MARGYQCRRCKGPVLTHEWEGPCPNCGGFYRGIVTMRPDDEIEGAEITPIEEGKPISAGDLFAVMGDIKKIQTGMTGFDYIFNGGLPPHGGGILLCAAAGTGKSTLCWILLQALAAQKIKGIYVSAEQTLKDLGQQFSWLGKPPREASRYMLVHHERSRDNILEDIEQSEAKVAIVDSLHTVEDVTDAEGFSMATGGAHAVAQVGSNLKHLAGELGITIFAIGHVNNDGTIAGGTRVRHMLDAVLVMRPGVSEKDERRILEFEGKTRFGPRGRRALFKMNESGLVDCGPLVEEFKEDSEAKPAEKTKKKYVN